VKITIIGGGKVGTTIARQLTAEDHDITLIDKNRAVTEQIASQLDIMTVCGSGAILEVLQEAGAPDCDLLVACTNSDELNLVCCIFAKKLGCKNTIARVRTPEYAQQIYFIKDDLNLSTTINPELIAAREIFRMLQMPGVLKREPFAEERAEIVEVVSRRGDKLDGVTLYDLSKKLKLKALVVAVSRGEEVFIPSGSFTLRAGDKVYVCAPATELVKILKTLGDNVKRPKNLAIIGASRTTDYLISMLLKTGTSIKLIEIERKKANFFAKKYPEVDVICADGSSEEILKSERVDLMDAVVSLTNMDEENLILSMYLSEIGVSQVIAKVDHIEYASMFARVGINRIVSPKRLAANEIIRYVRAMENSDGGSVVTLRRLVDERVEALEFIVTKGAENRGRMLKDIRFKKGVLLAGINRMGRIIIPGGLDFFEAGDTVIIVTTTGNVFLDLNDIFENED